MPPADERDVKYWHLDREVASLKDEHGMIRRDVAGMKADIAGIKSSIQNVAEAVHAALEQSRPRPQNVWQVIGGVVVLVGALAGYVNLTMAPVQLAVQQERQRLDKAFALINQDRKEQTALLERIVRREAKAELTEEFMQDGLARLRGLEIKNGHSKVQ